MEKRVHKDMGFDESFKILAKDFFGQFSKVITDVEILKGPRKADVLVVETDKPVAQYLHIFDYFKKVNIIEFKSVNDPFRLEQDLPRVLIYIGGILLNERKSVFENTTFTLFSSRKPEKLFTFYKMDLCMVKPGVYLLEYMAKVPFYIVLANEVPPVIPGRQESGLWSNRGSGMEEKELALIKEFSTGNERVRFLEKVVMEVLGGNDELIQHLHLGFSLYREEIKSIIEKEGVSMMIVEKNIRAWVDDLGLKEKYMEEGIKEGKKTEKIVIARKMLEKGVPVEDIMDFTGLSREEVLKLSDSRE